MFLDTLGTGWCRSPHPGAAVAGDGHDTAALFDDHIDVCFHDLSDFTHLEAQNKTNLLISMLKITC